MNNLLGVKVGTLSKILKSLPTNNPMSRIARNINITEGHLYNVMKLLSEVEIIKYKKVGRTNRITLLPKGSRLKDALMELVEVKENA